MVKKRGTISANYEYEFTIIGIACHIPEYRVVHFLNKISNFNFIRLDDLIINKGEEEEFGFPFYFFKDIESGATFHLIANRFTERVLIKQWKQIDFLLIAFGSNHKVKTEEIVKEIRIIPNVIAVSEMPITKKLAIDNFMTDLELHINEIQKREKEKDKEISNKLRTNRYGFVKFKN